eukprot:TRINITY_DN18685_c0_g1_i1.p1 TRINITY_DN18685_c0_g1~~TRINITY_DN18685_c0_g1_i1.p1  ORF type:complete len:375 (-),score=56.51 TRINITY_DN18685_c0_g1_i1:106-1230(-)
MVKLLSVLLLVCVCQTTLASITCIDGSGSSVDWFFMLKLPDVVGDYKGYTYLYVDPNNNQFLTGDFHDSSNAVAQTVSQIGLYGGSVDTSSVGYVLWNDQTYESLTSKDVDHEQDPSGVYYAHSKATIGFDSTSGFWLAHSAPGFPYMHSICPSSWSFPTAQSEYAQHFFCVSINSQLINTISKFLLNYYAYVYDYNVPSSLSNLDDFKTFVSGKYLTGYSSLSFLSLGGSLNITAFGKHGATQSDMYEDYVAPGIEDDLWVESWCCGTYGDCCMQSYCSGSPIVDPSNPQKDQTTYQYDSIDIEKFEFASNLYYSTANNHAKFALSKTGDYVCPSDNNRALTQRNRGGGSLCFENQPLYNFLYSHITAFNTTC